MTKQPLKKKEIKSTFNVKDLKKKMGLSVESIADINKSNTDKPLEWITMPKAFQESLKIPGIPIGYFTGVMGWSDTGKSTLKNCAIASAMKQGIMPVIFETEGNFDFQHAIDCGMDIKPVEGDMEIVDEETGEVKIEKRIIDYEGDYILFNNNTICEFCGDNDYATGTKKKTKRKVAVIEDIAYIINTLLDMQDNGEIEKPLFFVWDSVGSIPSWKSLQSKTGNPMFDAAALSASFNIILNARIPTSRRIGSTYTNTFFTVNKIWNDSMNSMGGVPSLELKGGKSFFYAMRLLIHVGGAAKAATKKLKATFKGQEYRYGIISKVKVVKNHLPSPYNVTYEGSLCCVHNGLCSENELDQYKKQNMPLILNRIQELFSDSDVNEIKSDDISFIEDDTEGND